jgi:hypothetical protein
MNVTLFCSLTLYTRLVDAESVTHELNSVRTYFNDGLMTEELTETKVNHKTSATAQFSPLGSTQYPNGRRLLSACGQARVSVTTIGFSPTSYP